MSDNAFADFAWRYVNDERMDDATFRSLIRHHPAVTDLPSSSSPEGMVLVPGAWRWRLKAEFAFRIGKGARPEWTMHDRPTDDPEWDCEPLYASSATPVPNGGEPYDPTTQPFDEPFRHAGDAFVPADYRELHDRLMSARADDVSAILSNNFNVVLGSLRQAMVGCTASSDARSEIIRLMREDFDPTPPNWEDREWNDNAEDVAAKIIAVALSEKPTHASDAWRIVKKWLADYAEEEATFSSYRDDVMLDGIMTAGERRRLSAFLAPADPPGCSMGIGCAEAGICYAQAHGKPDECGRVINRPFASEKPTQASDEPPQIVIDAYLGILVLRTMCKKAFGRSGGAEASDQLLERMEAEYPALPALSALRS